MTAQRRVHSAIRSTLMAIREERQRQRRDLVLGRDRALAAQQMADSASSQIEDIDADLAEIAAQLRLLDR